MLENFFIDYTVLMGGIFLYENNFFFEFTNIDDVLHYIWLPENIHWIIKDNWCVVILQAF